MNNINVHCQGESHKASDKPCQDYSYSSSSPDLSIAVVCDGHGGDRYFRSQWGAQFATEVIIDVVKDFVKQTSKSLFKDMPFTAEGVVTGSEKKLSILDKDFRQMFSSIITRWGERIKRHASDNPVNEWEREHVAQKYLDELESGVALEKQYGCTLMAYVQTKTYWFAFHLGDGKCIAFHDDDRVWSEPIPWDERCFLNKTTSICDSDALNEFRYCYEGDGKFPVAIFLGSDGIDDTYGEMENIANFYIEILKIIAKDGIDTAIQQLKDDLPIISRIGSKDDVAVATVFDVEKVKENIGRYITFQIEYITRQADEQKERIEKQMQKKATLTKQLSEWLTNKQKTEIDLNYAIKELDKATDRLEVLSGKIDFLSKEYSSRTGKDYTSRPDYSEVLENAKEASKETAVPDSKDKAEEAIITEQADNPEMHEETVEPQNAEDPDAPDVSIVVEIL